MRANEMMCWGLEVFGGSVRALRREPLDSALPPIHGTYTHGNSVAQAHTELKRSSAVFVLTCLFPACTWEPSPDNDWPGCMQRCTCKQPPCLRKFQSKQFLLRRSWMPGRDGTGSNFVRNKAKRHKKPEANCLCTAVDKSRFTVVWIKKYNT